MRKQPAGTSSNDAMKECDGDVEMVNGCVVCQSCGHGAARAKKSRTSDTGAPYKDLQDAANMMHNYFQFKNEEVFEEEPKDTLKRKRL